MVAPTSGRPEGASPRRAYPVSLVPTGRRCVVVGGGEAATRRVRDLLGADALVRVVPPALSPALAELVVDGGARHEARRFRAERHVSGRSTEGADWRAALDSGILDLIRAGRLSEAEELLRSCL